MQSTFDSKLYKMIFFLQKAVSLDYVTYKWNVSLYLGDQVFDLDLVANFRFLSARWGPIRFVSTNARNIPDCTGHLRSLAATTAKLNVNGHVKH